MFARDEGQESSRQEPERLTSIESRAETRGNDVTRQSSCPLIGSSQAPVPLLKRSRLRALSFCLDAVRPGPTYLGSSRSAMSLLYPRLYSLNFLSSYLSFALARLLPLLGAALSPLERLAARFEVGPLPFIHFPVSSLLRQCP